jgi:hypothetical protein
MQKRKYSLAEMTQFDPLALTPFTEGPMTEVIWTSVMMSFADGTNTTAFDQYRQGIELTQQRYYYQGLVKIHSGEEQHITKQAVFGQARLRVSPHPRYEETDSFNPVTYIQFDHVIDPITLLRVYHNAFPIVISDIDRFGFLNGDGALEPLTIRAKAANYSPEAPFFAHDVRASFEEGNENYKQSREQIVNVFTPNDEKQETNYYDSVDSAAGMPLMGFVSPDVAHLSPHDDTKQRSGIRITSNMDGNLLNAILEMNPPDDGYLSSDDLAMTAGFINDDSRFGTDSIAFSGMAARLIYTSREVDV